MKGRNKKGRNSEPGNKQYNFARPKDLLRALGNRDKVAELMGQDHRLIARAWVTAAQLEGEYGARKAWVFGELNAVFSSLSPEVVARFCRDVLVGKESYGGRWPKCFLSGVDATVLPMLANATGKVEKGIASIAVDHLLAASPSAWDMIVNQAVGEGGRGADDAVKLFLASAFRCGKLPVPCPCDITVPRASEDSAQGENRAYTGDPRKGSITLEPAYWLFVSARSMDNAFLLVKRFIDDCSFPVKAQRLCQEAARCEEGIRGQVASWWKEFHLAVCGKGRAIRRWVPADGLVQVMVEVAGCSFAETGVGLATFYGKRPFPSLDVNLEYLLFGELFSEDGVLGEGGLLSVVEDYPHGSAQRGLRLVQNFALVRELHRIAFAEGYCGGQQRNRGSGKVEANRAASAHLAHFRQIGHRVRRDGTPWQPSEEALERVPSSLIVPPGHTYVSSPPLRSRQTHPGVKPLVIEVAVGEEVCRG